MWKSMLAHPAEEVRADTLGTSPDAVTIKSTAEGALLTISLFPFAVAEWVHEAEVVRWFSPVLVTAGLASLALAAGGMLLRKKPRLGVVLTHLGMLGLLLLLIKTLTQSQTMTLAVLLCMLSAVFWLWRKYWLSASLHPIIQAPLEARARLAALASLGFWTITSLMLHTDTTWVVYGSLAVSFLVISALVGQWLAQQSTQHLVRASFLGAAILISTIGIVFSWMAWWQCLTWATLVPVTAVVVLPFPRRAGIEQVDWWEPILGHPERLLAVTFLLLCVTGALVLSLSVSATKQDPVAVIDALFTAVSAVCVTGLIVLDTPVEFSMVGQVVILLLMQLGGLGIMTFSTVALVLLGGRMSLRHEGAIASLVSPQDRRQLFATARRVLLFTLSVEAVGAASLVVAFLQQGDGFFQGLWRAVFTAVSAFCNAGFTLQSDNLVSYQHNPWVLYVVSTLIILGGLSPAVCLAVPHLLRRTLHPISAQTKITLSATAMLLVGGFFFFVLLEWTNALAGLSFWDRIHNAWFQSATLRTAGFNSVDITSVHSATLSLMLIWMFVGGSPAGTAGGIKTTTAAVLVLAVAAAVRGRWEVTAFARRISHKTVYKAAAITTVGAATALVFLIAMQLTQVMDTDEALFETVSALGTVGLSIGGTAQLDGVGKALIIACMFAGRIGPLTLFMFLSSRVQQAVWARPEEEIEVG
jgi:trk system potassium uptake protein TrkH